MSDIYIMHHVSRYQLDKLVRLPSMETSTLQSARVEKITALSHRFVVVSAQWGSASVQISCSR